MTLDAVESQTKKIVTDMGLRRSPNTISTYRYIFSHFCRQTHKTEKWNRTDLLGYFDSMIKDGYNPGTIKKHFAGLKRCFKALKTDFSIDIDDMPKGQNYQAMQPVTKKEDIERLVKAARGLSHRHHFYITVSCIYGLRREEMARLNPSSFVRIDGKIKLKVETAKHGMPRNHLIPPEVALAIGAPLRNQGDYPLGVTMLSLLFHEIAEEASYITQEREGWHGIRRALDIGLIDSGLPEAAVKNFLRWSPGSNMAHHYYTGDERIDEMVFAKHPFLEIWK